MVYTPLTRKAMEIACCAHQGQRDKAGFPYIHHPLHVAEQMEDEYSCTAALLHDVVEDTAWTLKDLERAGIPTQVLEALKLLTHDDATPYLEYVKRLGRNPIARAVKEADLLHNSDLNRLEHVGEKELRRVEKYAAALALLRGHT